jgi:hypothetical protein
VTGRAFLRCFSSERSDLLGESRLAVRRLVLVQDTLADGLVFMVASAAALSPAVTAVRVERMSVLSSLLTALLRSRAFSLVLLRLICDLMFATCGRFLYRSVRNAGSRRGLLHGGREGRTHTQAKSRVYQQTGC